MPNVEEGYERFGVSEGYRMWEWVGENTGGMPTLEGGGKGKNMGVEWVSMWMRKGRSQRAQGGVGVGGREESADISRRCFRKRRLQVTIPRKSHCYRGAVIQQWYHYQHRVISSLGIPVR